MDRINSSTRSGILLETLYYLDKYETERIILYKSLQTANRIQISIDFSTQLIYISAILPINSVDLTKSITDPQRVVFPNWNTVLNTEGVTTRVLIPGYTESVDFEYDEENQITTITVVMVLDYYEDVLAPTLVYSTALTMQGADNVRQTPRKNIQVTIDEPELKAIVEAVLPFDSYLNTIGELVITPLDD
jgi:hypothetical protein